MGRRLSQFLFGAVGKGAGKQTVDELIARLRRESGEAEHRLIVAHVDDTVAEAHEAFRSHDFHHLPVVEGAKVVGIVSLTDLLTFFSSNPLVDPAEVRLQQIMTPMPQVIRRDAHVEDLVKTLAHSSFRCLPVVNENDDLWAIVTTRDLVRLLELHYGAA